MKDLKETTMTFRIPVYLKRVLHELAKKHGISVSAFIRGLIQIEYQETFESSEKCPMGESWLEKKLNK